MDNKKLPIYLITNRNLVSNKKYFQVIKDASYAGIERIILREKDLTDEQYKELYFKVKSLVKDDTEIIINSKIKVFNEVKPNILHLPFKDFIDLKNFKGDIGDIGVSVHSLQEGIEADKKGVKYILASHIFETKCKEGLKPKGIEFIKELRKNVSCEIIALGGIDIKNYKSVISAGADGIAMMSLLFLSDNVNEDIYKFYKEIILN